jgi:prephenate dehydrogenase
MIGVTEPTDAAGPTHVAATAPDAAAAAHLPPALCVLGLGLIGGSLLRAAGPLVGEAFGWSPSPDTRGAAAADGFQVQDDLNAALDRATATDALVVMASPITAFGSLLKAVKRRAPTIRLTDVGGVKGPVADQVAALAPKARYVGSHPMTGTAHSGWAAGSAALFRDHAWVACLDEDTAIGDWATVAALGLAVGSRVVPIEPAVHDDAAARISHLPHLLALALAQVGAGGGAVPLALAAGSFADGTRVAGTRPELVRAMCEGNAEPLINVMDEALALIGVARASLASTGSLARLAERGHAARMVFDHRADHLQSVTISGDDLAEQLLAVGAAGGYVTALTSTASGLQVAAMYPDDV